MSDTVIPPVEDPVADPDLPVEIPTDPVDNQTDPPEDNTPPEPVEDAYIVEYQGREVEVSVNDLPELIALRENRNAELASLAAERDEVMKYKDLLNFINNDDFAQRVLSYRMDQGNDPRKIAEFLYNHYTKEPEMDPNELPEVREVKTQLSQLEKKLQAQEQASAIQAMTAENTRVINEAWNGLGLVAKEGDYPKVVEAINAVGSKLYGVPNFNIASVRLNRDMVEAILERTQKAYPNLVQAGSPNQVKNNAVPGVRRVLKQKTPVQQLPGSAGAGTNKVAPTDNTPAELYSPRAAREKYAKIFG